MHQTADFSRAASLASQFFERTDIRPPLLSSRARGLPTVIVIPIRLSNAVVARPSCLQGDFTLQLNQANCATRDFSNPPLWRYDLFHPGTSSRHTILPVLFPATYDPGCSAIYTGVPFPAVSASRLTYVLRWICFANPFDTSGETLSATESLFDAFCDYAQQLWSFTGIALQRLFVRFQNLACHQLEYIFHKERHIVFVHWYSHFCLENFVTNHSHETPNFITYTVQFTNIFPGAVEIIPVVDQCVLRSSYHPTLLPVSSVHDVGRCTSSHSPPR